MITNTCAHLAAEAPRAAYLRELLALSLPRELQAPPVRERLTRRRDEIAAFVSETLMAGGNEVRT
ncbi:hypothetical protein ACWDBD_48110 [Streptomyces sp. NPDC001118]